MAKLVHAAWRYLAECAPAFLNGKMVFIDLDSVHLRCSGEEESDASWSPATMVPLPSTNPPSISSVEGHGILGKSKKCNSRTVGSRGKSGDNDLTISLPESCLM